MEENKKIEESKKVKNLISIIILLSGLFLGSLFVDVAQIMKGAGYSQKNLNKSDIFEANGKTWVAYGEPAVEVSIINDDTCEKCDISEPLVWLRRVLPTVSTEKVTYDSVKGKELIDKFGIKTLPAFIFNENIEKTDFYLQASVLFNKKDNLYVLKTQELGLPAGKYLELPKAQEGDATFGLADSKVTVAVFSDYQCPYCKILYQTLRTTMNQYKDKVAFVYKHLPLDIHPQAENASLAAECALEQGKFWEYSDRLYQNQASWSNTKDMAKFKEYAQQLGLKSADFNQCLDSKKYQEKINRSKEEADGFGISGTPAVFINDQFETGAISAEQFKKIIDEQLNK
ncbi:MAG TPA: thioredoxin domain-containing protein [Candidatus Moranbacteria bacterium]|nr:thioredoxin domain-containing protein [Candidatus Moranbacteria bacterium]